MKTNDTLYLKSLNLQNFATFQNQTIVFDPKFNAIVGETGSGKSLILDALQMIFGGRTDKKLIRKDSDFATIEAIFKSNDSQIKNYFNEIGHPYDGDEIIVKRIIYTNDNSKSFLNFQSCSATTLTNFSKRFIDLVGQFENQKLLSEDYQLVLLDSFSNLKPSVEKYQKNFSELSQLKKLLENLIDEKNIQSQREDYIRFQLDEINKLDPSVEDEEELTKKKDFILNIEKRQQVLASITSAISEDEINMLNMIKACLTKADKAQGIISNEIVSKLYEVKALLEDVSFDLSKEMDFSVEDEDLNEVIDRLDSYQKLKRKFGGSTEKMMQAFEEFQNELNNFNDLEEKILLTTKQVAQLEAQCMQQAEELHAIRVQKAVVLSNELSNKIRDLKMSGATVKINLIKTAQLNAKGLSKVEFNAETNPGEGFFKVKEIASGGELSRILLSVRQILSSNDTISVFLFDEIDTGIGGETALAIGKSLDSVANASQVLAITHLPQIANFANHLINVSKSTLVIDEQPRTVSLVEIAIGEQKASVLKQMNPTAH